MSVAERVVGLISPLNIKGMAVVEVAMAARFEMEVLERDPEFHKTAVDLWLHFAKGLVIDGAFASWLGVGINATAGAIAKELASDMVKQFVIKKGMEASVKALYKKAMGRD